MSAAPESAEGFDQAADFLLTILELHRTGKLSTWAGSPPLIENMDTLRGAIGYLRAKADDVRIKAAASHPS